MPDTINRDNTPPHYEADAGGAGHDETPAADVRAEHPPGRPVQCQVGEAQRLTEQPYATGADTTTSSADSCCPAAALDGLLEEIVSNPIPHQKTTSPTAIDGHQPVPFPDTLSRYEHNLPPDSARHLRTDPEDLRARLTRLNNRPEWRRT